jgi:hypothetical protein
MIDPWTDRMSRIIEAVRSGPGSLPAEVRQAIMDGESIPEPLASYVSRVASHAREITDEDVQALLLAGFTEEQVFEATVSSAVGAGRRRLEAGLAALREAHDAP